MDSRSSPPDALAFIPEWIWAVLVAIWPLILAVGLSALGIMAAVVLSVIAMIGLLLFSVPLGESLILLVGLSLLLQGIGFLIAAVAYLSYRGLGIEYIRLRRPTLQDFGWMIGGLFGLFAVLIVVGGLAQMFAPADPADHEIAELGAQQPELLLFMVPFMLLVVGPGEELLFRGVIQTRLVETYDTIAGIVAASAIFALLHLPAYGGGAEAWVTITVLFVASLVFGAIYEITDNLVVPSVVHGVYNSILIVGLYVELEMDLAMLGPLVGV